jgi:GNAT superfamily N-acetyltransferase
LSDILGLYSGAGISRFFLHVLSDNVDDRMEALLVDSGYRRHRGWMKFTRGAGDVLPATSDLTVRAIDSEHASEFARIAATGFGLRPDSEPILAALSFDPNWHLYMSFDGETPAGTGALYVRDKTGYLDWAATTPEFRRRGSQSAILSTRIAYALAMGCRTIVTMTGEAVPGDPQHSYSNILKSGFAEAYLRENWIPADD